VWQLANQVSVSNALKSYWLSVGALRLGEEIDRVL
jgi:hypothetical protein